MPNGLACSPRYFTKILKPIYAKMGLEGCETFPYLDDSFVISDSKRHCAEALNTLCTTLHKLGFVVHTGKSVLEPTKKLKFLGFMLDSESMTVTLTDDKCSKFTRLAEDILGRDLSTIREVAGLVGMMIAFAPGIEYGNAHIKALERDKNKGVIVHKGDYEGLMWISFEAGSDINWWLTHLQTNARVIRRNTPSVTIYTDASTMDGMGRSQGCYRRTLE